MSRTSRVDAGVFMTLWLIAFGLYRATMCPGLWWYDSAEFVAAAKVAGIPHPPGYPLYVSLAHLFTQLPVETARAVNLMSVVFGATVVASTYGFGRLLGATRAASIAVACVAMTGRVLWESSIVAEVYAPGLFGVAIVWLLLLRARRDDHPRLLVAAALVAGLALGLHLFVATCGLGYAWLVWGQGLESPRAMFGRDGASARVRRAALCALAALAGSGVFLLLPLRAAADPAVNFGDPSSLTAFIEVVTAREYAGLLGSGDPILALQGLARMAVDVWTIPGLMAVALGVAVGVRRHPMLAAALGLGMLGNVASFVTYRVHDLHVFFAPTMWMGLGFMAWGFDRFGEVVGTAIASRAGEPAGRRSTAVVVAALGVVPAAHSANANYAKIDLSERTEPQLWLDTIVEKLPPNTILLAPGEPMDWARLTVFHFWGQQALGLRPDVQMARVWEPAVMGNMIRNGVPVFSLAPSPMPTEPHYVLVDVGPILMALPPERVPPGARVVPSRQAQ